MSRTAKRASRMGGAFSADQTAKCKASPGGEASLRRGGGRTEEVFLLVHDRLAGRHAEGSLTGEIDRLGAELVRDEHRRRWPCRAPHRVAEQMASLILHLGPVLRHGGAQARDLLQRQLLR